jgi:hypothetical protein
MLMLIQFFDGNTMWMWAVIWRYMLPSSSGSKCVGWESIYAYIGLCFEKKKYGRRVGVGAPSGKIEIVDWENCTRKEMALLRAMQ